MWVIESHPFFHEEFCDVIVILASFSCLILLFFLFFLALGINSYEDLGGKALQKPGKVSVDFWIAAHLPCQKVYTSFSTVTRELAHTDCLFRFWLESLFLSKISVVSEPPVQCAVTYIISDMLDRN